MILRALPFLLLLLLLPALHFEWHFVRRARRRLVRWLWRAVLYVPSLALAVWAVVLARGQGFAPADTAPLFLFLFAVCVWAVPQFVFCLCSAVGRLCVAVSRRLFPRKRRHANYGNIAGFVLAAATIYIMVCGATSGVSALVVRHVDVSVQGLPAAFDGYRIAFFSDAHLGTNTPARTQQIADSINAAHADLIAFGGDLQNLRPAELYAHLDALALLHAPDGVVSVLGNHDYAEYAGARPEVAVAYARELQARERQMGWQLLLNSHIDITRPHPQTPPHSQLPRARRPRPRMDTLHIAGVEDGGRHHLPRANASAALAGIPAGGCAVLLQHDPTTWTTRPTAAALTLSGHTHGGQVQLFGLRFTRFIYPADLGLHTDGGRTLYVSAGCGSFLPFRYNVPAEVAVITLHAKQEVKN